MKLGDKVLYNNDFYEILYIYENGMYEIKRMEFLHRVELVTAQEITLLYK